mmetsp:Transcript_924/g.2126  ORF Transcript_924/g.2126 Transcript_924/m.2126 type:complete len:215 (-) Transcript_924:285-929(-)
MRSSEICYLVILQVRDLFDLHIQVFAEGLVLDLIMVHRWQRFLRGVPLDQIEVGLHLFFTRLLAPVGITVHPIPIALTKAVSSTLFRCFCFGLGFGFLCLASFPSLLFLGFHHLLCLLVLGIRRFDRLGRFFGLVGIFLHVFFRLIVCFLLSNFTVDFLQRPLGLARSTEVGQHSTRVCPLLRSVVERSEVTVVAEPTPAAFEDEARPGSQELR